MDVRHSPYIDSNCSLPILIGVCLGGVVFGLVVSRFCSIDTPVLGAFIDRLSYEETFVVFNHLGLDFLALDGSFITLLWLYVTQLGNIIQLINFNLVTLHPEVLMSILDQLKFLISVNELLFQVMSRLVSMSEHMDIDIGYDQYSIEEDIRTTGNNLYTLYRRIESALDYQNDDDLPIHWAENEAD